MSTATDAAIDHAFELGRSIGWEQASKRDRCTVPWCGLSVPDHDGVDGHHKLVAEVALTAGGYLDVGIDNSEDVIQPTTVRVALGVEGRIGVTPAEARSLAAALVRAADLVEHA